MIWITLAILTWIILLVLVAPLIKKGPTHTDHAVTGLVDEITIYEGEITRLDKALAQNNDPNLEAQKIDFQRKILALAQTAETTHTPISPLMIGALVCLFLFGAVGLYSQLGQPKLANPENLQTMASTQAVTQAPTDQTLPLDDLVERLGEKLQGESRNDPEGWGLYARSLMNLQRYEEAFAAYEQLLRLTDNDPNIASELEAARQFATQQATSPGPSAADIDAAQSMSPEDRALMINNMVESLATRLVDNPDDVEGWVRLLRSRRVLGQTNQAKIDIQTVTSFYKDKPEITSDILNRSGWK